MACAACDVNFVFLSALGKLFGSEQGELITKRSILYSTVPEEKLGVKHCDSG